MYDEELFLALCKKYDVEVLNGPGKNILIENGIEKEITIPFLKETLVKKRVSHCECEIFYNHIINNFKILNIEEVNDYKENYSIAC